MKSKEIDRIECAIRHIESSLDVDPWAVEIAVEAMKAQLSREDTTSDLISRRVAVDALWEIRQKEISDGRRFHDYCSLSTAVDVIKDLPSAQPEIEERTEEFAQNVPKEDLISRNAAIDAIANCTVYGNADELEEAVTQGNDWNRWSGGVLEALEAVKGLPSAQPERKKGWWLIREGISDAQCSECGMYFRDVYDMENSDAFCRQCGTKMEGLKVVEDE